MQSNSLAGTLPFMARPLRIEGPGAVYQVSGREILRQCEKV